MSKTDEQQVSELLKQKELTAFLTQRRNSNKRANTCPVQQFTIQVPSTIPMPMSMYFTTPATFGS